MKIQENVSLHDYSTMRLGGPARYLVTVTTADEMDEAFRWATQHDLPFIVIGGGSNIIWQDEGYPGLVIVDRILGFECKPIDDTYALFSIGAGENWDDVVEKTVNMGYSGLEFLSWIPGRAGATPVQNVGAYGREVSEVIESVQAIDSQTGQHVVIPANECDFAYRTSRFNRQDKGRFLITAIVLKLSKQLAQPPFYVSVEEYLEVHQINTYTPQILREAVIDVRKKKLPDPDVVANNGSFFANPIVDEAKYADLINIYPDLVFWPMPDGRIKISAAWLIDQAGFKDFHDPQTGMATWEKQPLVLINEAAQSTADVLAFKAKIVDTVKQRFGVELQQEPELI